MAELSLECLPLEIERSHLGCASWPLQQKLNKLSSPSRPSRPGTPSRPSLPRGPWTVYMLGVVIELPLVALHCVDGSLLSSLGRVPTEWGEQVEVISTNVRRSHSGLQKVLIQQFHNYILSFGYFQMHILAKAAKIQSLKYIFYTYRQQLHTSSCTEAQDSKKHHSWQEIHFYKFQVWNDFSSSLWFTLLLATIAWPTLVPCYLLSCSDQYSGPRAKWCTLAQ